MTADDNKATYRRFIQAIFNEARFEELASFLADDYAIKDAPPGSTQGAGGVREVVTMFHTGFPDMVITLDDVIGEGDWVATKSTLRGTHQGELFGMPASGKPVSMTSLTMIKFRDGKMTESWVKSDVMALMAQLGAQA